VKELEREVMEEMKCIIHMHLDNIVVFVLLNRKWQYKNRLLPSQGN
jgi:hypothetical protein